MSQILSLTEAQVTNKTIQELYDVIAQLLNHCTGNEKYDCRKINVSSEIQERVFTTYRRKLAKQYKNNPEQVDEQIAVSWVIAGPKVSNQLKGFQVEILPGFIGN